MSRDPRYQKLLNSKQWQEVKAIVWKRANGLCEMCMKEGIVTGSLTKQLDCHHIVPVESGRTVQEMERLAYDPANCQLLCVEHHIKVHQSMRTHCKEKVKENKERARQRFLEANDPNYITEETMQENKRLGIFGTLNYDNLKGMTMDERKLAVTNHAKDVLTRKKATDGKGQQIPDDDYDTYDVTAEYTIMDYHYNKQGKILATFKVQRTDEGLTIELTSFESFTD